MVCCYYAATVPQIHCTRVGTSTWWIANVAIWNENNVIAKGYIPTHPSSPNSNPQLSNSPSSHQPTDTGRVLMVRDNELTARHLYIGETDSVGSRVYLVSSSSRKRLQLGYRTVVQMPATVTDNTQQPATNLPRVWGPCYVGAIVSPFTTSNSMLA